MLEQLHRAGQYLSTFSISFLEHKQDDSHTNLGWNTDTSQLDTWTTENGNKFSLSFKDFSLKWSKNDEVISILPLNGAKHFEILQWINALSNEEMKGKTYDFALHYELPYDAINGEYRFRLSSEEEISNITKQLNNAQNAFENFLNVNSMTSNIRVWPHHFDLGIFIQLENEIGLGIGLAIPDAMVDSFYYYASGWKGQENVDTEGMPELNVGKWMHPNWKGAVLNSTVDQDDSEIAQFLNEAKAGFLIGQAEQSQ